MRKVPKFLHVLLNSDDVDSAEYKAAVAQLEREPQWQPALEQLALGDSNWWSEAREVLADSGVPASEQSWSLSRFDSSESSPRVGVTSSSITVEIESSMAADTPIDCERVTLDFLEAPSHPELLGRIGRYEVERVLGTGGMGVVLRAYDTDLHRIVAIKVLASHLANNSSARRRFAREAQAAAAVVHPNVVPIYNVESDAKTPYIVMHYVAGQSLQRRVDIAGPLPIVDALRIAQQTAAGLSAAHAQGLVHRDVKPANILLEEQIDRVLLSDFGLARAVDDASLTKTGIVAGTPHYMSPEQALGESVDHRSDVFSLGSVLYFMLSGHPPFRASSAMAVLHRICQFPHRSLVEVNRDVPIEVSRLVDRLLSKKQSERIATAAEAEKELASLLTNLQQRGVSIQSSELEPVRLMTQVTAIAQHKTVRALATLLVCVGLILFGRSLPTMMPALWPVDSGGVNELGLQGTGDDTSSIVPLSSEPLAGLKSPVSEHDLAQWLAEEQSWQMSSQQQLFEIGQLNFELEKMELDMRTSVQTIDVFQWQVEMLDRMLSDLQCEWQAEDRMLEESLPRSMGSTVDPSK